MKERIVVIDSNHPLSHKNQCFSPFCEYTGAGHAINVRLYKEAKKRGIKMMTQDVYLAYRKYYKKYDEAFCITDMFTSYTKKLISKGVFPLICICLESPIVAKRFYHNIDYYAKHFRHVFCYKGTERRLSRINTIFHPVVFPVETQELLNFKTWTERKFLILVNSNKRAIFRDWTNFKKIIKSILWPLYEMFLKIVDPWMRIPELYKERIKAIYYFSNNSEIDLFGIGWQKPIIGFPIDYHRAILKVYKGIIPADVRAKRVVMSNYKFAICFENCCFPGFITEKIFDCFLAGCIPVYYGAPDITDFIPKETFIDFRNFKSYYELDKFLQNISEKEVKFYLEAAQDFVRSKLFEKFTVDYFVNKIMDIISSEFS